MEDFLTRISPDMIAIVMLAFILYLLHNDRMIGKRQAKALSMLVRFILVIVLLEISTIFLEGMSSTFMVLMNKVFNVLGFSLTSMIGIFLAVIYLPNIKRYMLEIMMPVVILVILCFLSIWTGWVFSVDVNGHYERGPLFLYNILVNLYALGVYYYALKIKGRSYDKSEQMYLVSEFYIILFGAMIQIIFPKVLLLWPCFAFVILLYYDFLKALSYRYDSLTEIKNRRCFDVDYFDAKESDDLYIVIFDINNLKLVNDQYGHTKGDEYIQKIVDVIKKHMGPIGVLYRIGGDEFCCLCEYIPENVLLQALIKVDNGANNIHMLKDTFEFNNILAYGYAHYSKREGISIDVCLKNADQAMYMCKNLQKEPADHQETILQ